MRIVKVGVLAPTNKGIPLGVQGESRATQVEFDTRPWFREYPSGTVSAVATRDGDPAPYPLTLDVEDGTAVWLVSDTDTAKAGEGAVELTMTSAGARARSLTFKTLVTASLTDAPVDDDAWYGWLDKAVVKVDETVQSAQMKMAEVDAEWTGLKADVTAKVEECGEAAAQAASDAHHAKVDAQATAKALESAEGSVAKAEAAAKRAVDAMLDADDSAVEASRSALSAGDSAEAARLSADAAANSADNAATSASNAADAASAASGSASAAEQSAADASNAKVAAQTAKAEAAMSASNAATSASNAATSATAAAKSASDAAASVGAINVISPKRVAVTPIAEGSGAIALGGDAHANGDAACALGTTSHSVTRGVAIGQSAAVNNEGSVAIGAYSVSYKPREVSFGNENTNREITHVSTPTTDTSASTKKYTDDNDAKTLTEAKKYTDANTSNALVGTVSGKLLHVEDAWPSKPLSVTIDGAYKQDGTPSPDNPVPITVVENPVLKVTGADTSAASTSLPITLPAEHPYLAKLPDGTADTLEIDKYGNASLVARVKHMTLSEFVHLPLLECIDVYETANVTHRVSGFRITDFTVPNERRVVCSELPSIYDSWNTGKIGVDWIDGLLCRYSWDVLGIVDGDSISVRVEKLKGYAQNKVDVQMYYPIKTPVTYQLGKIDIPSLPETISNVWTDAELTTDMSMTYKRDINIVIADLTAQIDALKGTADTVHDDSTASPDDVIDV